MKIEENDNDLVSFEIAKLAYGKECIIKDTNYRYKVINNDFICREVDKNCTLLESEYYAPLQYQLQKLIREEFKIHIDIGIDDMKWNFQLFDVSKMNDEYEYNNISSSYGGYNSYEEALEDGLSVALTYI